MSSPPSQSMPPAGLPSSGNGKYVVVVAALVVGIAVLIGFKTCGDKPPPVPIANRFDAAPTPHEEENVPPPPPPDEPQGDAGRRTVTTFYDPCAVKSCAGATTQELENALAFRAKQAHRCYDQALAQDSELKGHVAITVRVASDGRVCAANVTDNDMGTNSVANCVLNTFRNAGHFPPPKTGCVDAKVPISFIPGGH